MDSTHLVATATPQNIRTVLSLDRGRYQLQNKASNAHVLVWFRDQAVADVDDLDVDDAVSWRHETGLLGVELRTNEDAIYVALDVRSSSVEDVVVTAVDA